MSQQVDADRRASSSSSPPPRRLAVARLASRRAIWTPEAAPRLLHDNGAEQLLDASGTNHEMGASLRNAVAERRTASTRSRTRGRHPAARTRRADPARQPKSHTIIDARRPCCRSCGRGRRAVGRHRRRGHVAADAACAGHRRFSWTISAPGNVGGRDGEGADPRYREAYAGARSPSTPRRPRAALPRGRARASGYLVQPLPLERDDATVTMSRMPVAPPATTSRSAPPSMPSSSRRAPAGRRRRRRRRRSRRSRSRARGGRRRSNARARRRHGRRAPCTAGATASVELNTDKPIGREAMLPLSEAQNVVLWALTAPRRDAAVDGGARQAAPRGACVVLAPRSTRSPSAAGRARRATPSRSAARASQPAEGARSRLARAVARAPPDGRPHKGRRRRRRLVFGAGGAAAASGAAMALRRSWVHQFALSARELRRTNTRPRWPPRRRRRRVGGGGRRRRRR